VGSSPRTDANTLVKSGVPVEEIIASLYEAVVYQNLASLTKGNTPLPEVLLLGGPNMFFHRPATGMALPPEENVERAQD
jgi:activator of 2-hydroxyglutaryl-CoA dehydratase